MTNEQSFVCTCCGEMHPTLPMSFGADAPAYYYAASEEERRTRFELTRDLCMMDDTYFFIRGCLELPVLDADEPFIWGVWVSLSEEDCVTFAQNWDNQHQLPAMYGLLSTDLPIYDDTLQLKAVVYFREQGTRPRIVLERTNHPLVKEMHDGITLARVEQIASELLCKNA